MRVKCFSWKPESGAEVGGPLRDHVLALLGPLVTPPDPWCAQGRQGLIEAKQQAYIAQAGDSTPDLKWKMVISHLPTHPNPSA